MNNNFSTRFWHGVYRASDSFLLLSKHKILLAYTIIPLMLTLGAYLIGYNYMLHFSEVHIHYIFGSGSLVEIFKSMPSWLRVIGALCLSWLTLFVTVFFSACLIHHTMRYLHGKDAHIFATIRAMMSRIVLLAKWTTIATIVICVLQIPSGCGLSLWGLMSKGLSNTNSIAVPFAVIVFCASITWSFLTLLVLPIISMENITILQAIRKSAALVRDHWIEIIGGQCWFGLVVLIIATPIVLIMALFHDQGIGALFIAGATIFGIFASCIISAAHAIFKTYIYYEYYKRALFELEVIEHPPF